MPGSPVSEAITPMPSASRSTALAQGRELPVAPDQRPVGGPFDALSLADHPVSVDRVGAAAEFRRPEILELEAVAHLDGRVGAEGDIGLARERLQPGGDVDGVAERVEAVGAVWRRA